MLQRLLMLPTEGRLLEVGGGTGRIAALLAPLVGQLVISDLSAPMLDRARSKAICCPVQALAERLHEEFGRAVDLLYACRGSVIVTVARTSNFPTRNRSPSATE